MDYTDRNQLKSRYTCEFIPNRAPFAVSSPVSISYTTLVFDFLYVFSRISAFQSVCNSESWGWRITTSPQHSHTFKSINVKFFLLP